MTTNNGAKAQQQDAATQPTGDDNGVAAAAAAASASNTEPSIDERIESVLESRLNQYGERVREIEIREQGRAQQWYGDKLKEVREQDRQELAGFMGDLTLVLDDDQRERLDELRAERENQQLRDEVARLRQTVEQPAPAQQVAMSESDGLALRSATEAVIEAAGLGITPDAPELWQGYTASMDLRQSIALMKQNSKALISQAKTPEPVGEVVPQEPPVTPAQRVPVSTNSAPSTPANQYDTLGELAIAFRNKEINSKQYAELAKESGWL